MAASRERFSWVKCRAEEPAKVGVATIRWNSVEPSVNAQRTLSEPSLNAHWSSTERSMERHWNSNGVFGHTPLTVESGRINRDTFHHLTRCEHSRLRQARHRVQAGVSGPLEAALEERCHALLTRTYPYPYPYPYPKREKDPPLFLSLDKLKDAFGSLVVPERIVERLTFRLSSLYTAASAYVWLALFAWHRLQETYP